jgi:1-acyl-sn-glycerol-3-phosphate acyltransferase
MQTMNSLPAKPLNEIYRPEITRLPQITHTRQMVRRVLHWVVKILIRISLRLDLHGQENIIAEGPLLVVSNHLGGADILAGLAIAPRPYDLLGKAEIYDWPIIGRLLEAYGTIWVHRGRPDRKAIKAALQGLAENRIIAIAPEGRESVTGELEAGTGGAAFIALKAGAPILPVVVTGTENWRVFGNLKRLRRTSVSISVGKQFYLDELPDRRKAIAVGTQKIMKTLAEMLPVEYRGIYR